MAHINGSLSFSCCPVAEPPSPIEVRAPAAQSGQLLAVWTCPACGVIYTAGVIVENATTFVPIEDAVLTAAGVDTEDYEAPDDPDTRMCVGCDTGLNLAYCPGCQEYVCSACMQRLPRAGKHQADEHWQEPKFAEVVTLSSEDDGSVLTGDDAIFVPEN